MEYDKQSTNYSCQCFESSMPKLCCNISFGLQIETDTSCLQWSYTKSCFPIYNCENILTNGSHFQERQWNGNTYSNLLYWYCKPCLTNNHCTEMNCFIASFAFNIFSPQLHTNIFSKLMTSVLHNLHIIHIFICSSQWAVLAQSCPVHV